MATPERLAAGAWTAAAAVYLTTEAMAASAFAPRYSYLRDYISDLGAPICGAIYQGRALCSPLHALANGGFVVEGAFFLVAALAIAAALPGRVRWIVVAFAACNALGNGLIAIVPETDPSRLLGGPRLHIVGAVLAIVGGNAAALASAWAFAPLRLPRIHRIASLGLPLAAVAALTALALGWAGPLDGLWERISVYAITAWELLTAACVIGPRPAV